MPEVVLVGGMPAGGKTTVTKKYVDQGYTRLNRDSVGGKVSDLIPNMTAALRGGKNVVMDNLYATAASRVEVIKAAKETKSPVTFVLMDTSLEDAQFNACLRMMERCGKVLHPDDHKKAPYKDDPNLFPVAVIYKYRKEFEKPTLNEGFTAVKTEKFVRTYPAEWVNKAVIFDFDGTLRTHVGDEKYPCKPEQVRAYKDRTARVVEYAKKGYRLFGASNQSGVAKGILSDDDAKACFDETLKQLSLHPDKKTEGFFVEEVLYCPHKVPPITCYCRKPGPGMLVELIWKYKLDPRQCIYVGDMTTDKSCAARSNCKFMFHDEFFR